MTDEPTRTIGTPQVSPPRGEVPADADLTSRDVTALDEVAAELLADVEDEPVVLGVPGRPGWEAIFRVNIDHGLLQKWAKASADKSMAGGLNELAFAQRILANLNVGLRRHGEDLTTNGEPLTVRSKAFLDLVTVGKPTDAVKKLFGKDSHVIKASEEIVSSAGYGDDLKALAEDPTGRR